MQVVSISPDEVVREARKYEGVFNPNGCCGCGIELPAWNNTAFCGEACLDVAMRYVTADDKDLSVSEYEDLRRANGR